MEFEAIASGLYLEGLASDGDVIWISDVVGGGLMRIAPDGQTQTYLKDKLFIAAVALHADGRLLYTGADGILWFDPTSGVTGVVVNEIDGAPIGGVNEMTPDGEGGLYFGTIDLVAIAKGARPGPSALYRLRADGSVTRLVGGLRFSNGLGLSPDRKTLYHNESFVGTFCYDIAADGGLGPARKLLENPDCDGMAIDQDGGIWISGFSSSQLLRLTPSGAVEIFDLPGEAATNVRLGGADGCTLLVNTVALAAAQALKDGKMLQEKTSRTYRARSPVAAQPTQLPSFKLK